MIFVFTKLAKRLRERSKSLSVMADQLAKSDMKRSAERAEIQILVFDTLADLIEGIIKE